MHVMWLQSNTYCTSLIYIVTVCMCVCVSVCVWVVIIVPTLQGELSFRDLNMRYCDSMYTIRDSANLSLSKKVLLSLKKHIFRWKKGFLRAERASRAQSAKSFRPGSSSLVLGALWCNLSLIFEHFYSKTHKFFINNVCKFQNFHSPVKTNKKTHIFFQEKTYSMRILHQNMDKICLKRTTWQLCTIHVKNLVFTINLCNAFVLYRLCVYKVCVHTVYIHVYGHVYWTCHPERVETLRFSVFHFIHFAISQPNRKV